MSAPSNRTDPARIGQIPSMPLTKLVLPAALGPIIPKASPAERVKIDSSYRWNLIEEGLRLGFQRRVGLKELASPSFFGASLKAFRHLRSRSKEAFNGHKIFPLANRYINRSKRTPSNNEPAIIMPGEIC